MQAKIIIIHSFHKCVDSSHAFSIALVLGDKREKVTERGKKKSLPNEAFILVGKRPNINKRYTVGWRYSSVLEHLLGMNKAWVLAPTTSNSSRDDKWRKTKQGGRELGEHMLF